VGGDIGNMINFVEAAIRADLHDESVKRLRAWRTGVLADARLEARQLRAELASLRAEFGVLQKLFTEMHGEKRGEKSGEIERLRADVDELRKILKVTIIEPDQTTVIDLPAWRRGGHGAA
jgi:hypothetical protein